jgi:pimeloyl-ACP methyl ester carboxylesterase
VLTPRHNVVAFGTMLVNTQGVNIWVHVAGRHIKSADNAMLLIHGFPDSSKLWDSQVCGRL